MQAKKHNDKGRAFEQEGLFKKAIEEYTQAIIIKPDMVEAYVGRAWSHLSRGNPKLWPSHPIKTGPCRCLIWSRLGARKIRRYRASDPRLQRSTPPLGINWERIILKPISVAASRNFTVTQPAWLPMIFCCAATSQQTTSALRPNLDVPRPSPLRHRWPREALRTCGADMDLTTRPGVLVSYYLGDLTSDRVLSAAQSANPKTQRENNCGANFFLGQDRLVRGDKAEVADYFRKTIATGVTSYRHYTATEEKLRRLGLLKK